jgi:hypothetical protein
LQRLNPPLGYRFSLKDGYHRYCLSIVVGFTEIPVVMYNFELSDLEDFDR